MVAPIAARSVDAAFLVLLAAPARDLVKVDEYQNTELPRAMGKSEEWINRHLEVTRELIKILKSAKTTEQVRQHFEEFDQTYPGHLLLLDFLGVSLEKYFELVPPIGMMWAIRYDPLPALKKQGVKSAFDSCCKFSITK